MLSEPLNVPVFNPSPNVNVPIDEDATTAYDDEITLFDPYGPNTPDAVTNEAVNATDADVIKPENEPLNDPECDNPDAAVVAR